MSFKGIKAIQLTATLDCCKLLQKLLRLHTHSRHYCARPTLRKKMLSHILLLDMAIAIFVGATICWCSTPIFNHCHHSYITLHFPNLITLFHFVVWANDKNAVTLMKCLVERERATHTQNVCIFDYFVNHQIKSNYFCRRRDSLELEINTQTYKRCMYCVGVSLLLNFCGWKAQSLERFFLSLKFISLSISSFPLCLFLSLF